MNFQNSTHGLNKYIITKIINIMKEQLQKVLNFLHELRAESLYKLHDQRREAMEIVTDTMKELNKITQLEDMQEMIADIAYDAGTKRYYSGNSREDMQHFIHLAKKFQDEVPFNRADEDNDDEPDYMDAMEDFCSEELKVASKLQFDYPNGAKNEWDNIEIEACKQDGDSVYPIRLGEDKNETPDFWTVYLHQTAGGVMAVADVPTEKDAKDLAELINNAVITYKDNGFLALYRNGEAHRKFNLFIDERIHMAHSDQTKAAYEVVKEFVNGLIKK